jgi:hypothetical protein
MMRISKTKYFSRALIFSRVPGSLKKYEIWLLRNFILSSAGSMIGCGI